MKHWNLYNEECACCGEQVGYEDSDTIRHQLQNREKNCFWCGDEFNISEEFIDDITGNACDYVDDSVRTMDFVSEFGQAETEGLTDDEKRGIIYHRYDIDIDKEPFIPPFINKKTGDVYDRTYDAMPYEKIIAEYAAHYTLSAVKNNPKISLNALEKKNLVPYMHGSSAYCRNAYSSKRYPLLNEKPISRLVVSGLVDVISSHHGWIKNLNTTSGQIFEKGVPMFRRNYTINKKGLGVLKLLEDKDKKVVIL